MNMLRCVVLLTAVAILSGAAPAGAEPGVTAAQITIGMTTALSGPASFLGTSFRAGVETGLMLINDAGGVHGRKIRLIAYDDGYEPKQAVINAERLIKQDAIFCFLGNVG